MEIAMKSSLVLIFLSLIVFNIQWVSCEDEEEEDLAATGPPDDEPVTTTSAPKAEAEDNTSEGKDKTTEESLKDMLKGKGSVKEKYNIFRKKAHVYVREKAKKILDILNVDLSKIDVRNLTQFIPFYNDYKKYFNKIYSSDAERKERTSFFKRSVQRIKEHNKKIKAKFQLGINELSDMTFSEILKQKLGFKNMEEKGDKVLKASAPVPPVTDMPEEWDWRKYGILTEPRNQGKCGSCWSFAASCVLESHNMKRQISEGKFDPKKQIFVSEQQLIDCSADFGTIGCDGGMPQQAFKYVAKAKGINGINIYPYKGKKEKCHFDATKKEDVVVIKGTRLKTGADDDLATAIYNFGPVAIAIHVTKDMAAYKAGIFEDPKCSAKKVNHAVVAVGYSKEYFIIRNSWGSKWGDGGYIKIARSKVNNCGVSQQGYYPVIPNAVETTEMKDKIVEIN